MRTVFDTTSRYRGLQTIADKLLDSDEYRDVRALAEVIEEIKHLARYMPQLFRLYELTKDLTEFTTIIDTGLPIREMYSAETDNLVAGQTEFIVTGGYVPKQIVISLNGKPIPKTGYVASNGVTFSLMNPVKGTDILEVIGTRSQLAKLITLQDVFENFTRAVNYRVSSADGNLTINQTIIPVPGGFRPGTLLVFRNGQILRDTDYVDTSGKQIILNRPLQFDDVIDIRGQNVTAPPVQEDEEPVPVSAVSLRISAADGNLTEGQTEIPVPGGFVPGTPLIFLDGSILQRTDYDDGSGTKIVLKFPLTLENIIDIRGHVASLPPLTNVYIDDVDSPISHIARTVFVRTLTASRTLTLPDIEAFPESTFLVIGDSSGMVSPEKYISIVPYGDNTIAQTNGEMRIAYPDTVVRFIRGSNKKWISL